MSDVIPATHLDLLESVAMAHIATIGPNGEPQNSPVWFGWDGEFIRFTQLTTLRQKARNLEREPGWRSRLPIQAIPIGIWRFGGDWSGSSRIRQVCTSM